MSEDVITTSSGTYRKAATRPSTSSQDKTPKLVVIESGLTVFLGGAGMTGTYNQDMVTALSEAGIKNAAYGNYAAYAEGPKRHLPDLAGMLGDASAVVLYNQDELDPVVFQYGEPANCKYGEEYIEKKYLFGTITIKNYKEVVCEPPNGVFLAKISRDISEIKKATFALTEIGIKKQIPKTGQFNLIGYSWGAVIAARCALFHARNGVAIDNLVLIGAPINKSLKEATSHHPRILKTHIIDLTEEGDPIYAGMTDKEIVDSAVLLGQQMLTGGGHFFYSGDSDVGRKRRRQLAKTLHSRGLR